MRSSFRINRQSVTIGICLLTFVFFFPLEGKLLAASLVCKENRQVTVKLQKEERVSLICRAAASAINFLVGFGIHQHKPIAIEVIDHQVLARGIDVYGSYDRVYDRLEVMSLTAIQRKGNSSTIFDEPLDEVEYAGVVAHEVTHAVVQQNMTRVPISPTAQEYLAYATQLAVLPPARRQRIIKRIQVDPWQSGDMISDAYMAIEPSRFAVKSYLHLTGMKNPSTFVKILLASNWYWINVP
jgi:Family of unknown function (DUF6639)